MAFALFALKTRPCRAAGDPATEMHRLLSPPATPRRRLV
jgi:hypothetical protein